MKFLPIAVICIALFAQVFSADPQIESAKDEAKKVFEKLMAAVDKALTEASNGLNSAVEKMNEKVTEYEGKAKDVLDKALEPVKAKLDEYIQEAADLGLDITNCQSHIDDLTNLPDKLVNELVSCMTEQVSKAQSYVDDALKNCKEIEQEMANYENDIDNCNGNAWKQAKCFAKIIEKMTKATEEAPQHIVEDFTKASALLTELIPIVDECFSEKVTKIETDGLEIIGEFALCIGVPTSK